MAEDEEQSQQEPDDSDEQHEELTAKSEAGELLGQENPYDDQLQPGKSNAETSDRSAIWFYAPLVAGTFLIIAYFVWILLSGILSVETLSLLIAPVLCLTVSFVFYLMGHRFWRVTTETVLFGFIGCGAGLLMVNSGDVSSAHMLGLNVFRFIWGFSVLGFFTGIGLFFGLAS